MEDNIKQFAGSNKLLAALRLRGIKKKKDQESEQTK